MKIFTKFQDFLNESENQDMYTSDKIRIQIIKHFLDECKSNPEYNIDEPDVPDLVDDWDGYDDQTYIQNISDTEFVYWEGWVKSCWVGAYKKPEYKGLSKTEVIENIINVRFPRIAEEFGYVIDDSEYFKYRGKYVMKITFSKK